MKKELNNIIVNEIDAVEELIKALELQHKCMAEKDVIGMDGCVANIEKCNRRIAEWETKRRQYTQGSPMSAIINEAENEELENNYRKIKKLLEEAKLQKDTNEILIKQGLGFTTRMLNIMNPDRTPKTYTAYGKMGR